MAEADQFAVDAAVAPRRVLGRKAKDQVAKRRRGRAVALVADSVGSSAELRAGGASEAGYLG